MSESSASKSQTVANFPGPSGQPEPVNVGVAVQPAAGILVLPPEAAQAGADDDGTPSQDYEGLTYYNVLGLRMTACSVALLALLTLTTVIAFMFDPLNNLLAIVLILGIPITMLYCCYHQFLRRSPLLSDGGLDDHMSRMMGGGFCTASICAIALELVLTLVFLLMFMQKELQEAAEEAENAEDGGGGAEDEPDVGMDSLAAGSLTFGGIVFLLCTSFVTAALVEESFKTCIVRWQCLPDGSACCVQPRPRHARSTFALLLASAVGFSTIENFGYVLIAPLGGVGVKLFAAAGRVFLSLPLHVVATSFTATRLALFDLESASGGAGRTCSAVQALWPGVLIHGTFDFVAFLAPLVAVHGIPEEERESDEAVRREVTAVVVVLLMAILVLAVSYYFLRQQMLLVIDREDAFYRSKACSDHPAHPATERVGAAAVSAGLRDPATAAVAAVEGSAYGTVTDAATALPPAAADRRRVAVLRGLVHPMDVRFGGGSGLRARQVAASPYVSAEQSAMGAIACWGYTEERALHAAVHGAGGAGEVAGLGFEIPVGQGQYAAPQSAPGGADGSGLDAGDIEMQLAASRGRTGSNVPAGMVGGDPEAGLGLLSASGEKGTDHRSLQERGGAL